MCQRSLERLPPLLWGCFSEPVSLIDTCWNVGDHTRGSETEYVGRQAGHRCPWRDLGKWQCRGFIVLSVYLSNTCTWNSGFQIETKKVHLKKSTRMPAGTLPIVGIRRASGMGLPWGTLLNATLRVASCSDPLGRPSEHRASAPHDLILWERLEMGIW